MDKMWPLPEVSHTAETGKRLQLRVVGIVGEWNQAATGPQKRR